MGLRTAVISAIVPGLGQIINGQKERALTIWTGLALSVILFPLPVFGSITFSGIYLANIYDAYDHENHFEYIDMKTWKEKSWDKMIEKVRNRSD